jgi:uncharacterized protein YgbK (DUF1537 family)
MVKPETISVKIFENFPAVNESYIDTLLREEIAKNNQKIIVLDDDPTGVQTVHDVSVYTDWTKENIRQGFSEKNKLFYILTNSRGFTAQQTKEAHKEIAEIIDETAKETGTDYVIISRSDSTLRGHYPLETEVLKETLESLGNPPVDGEIIYPFFKEGGRFTIHDIHYVKYGEDLVPAGETEFAKDKTFGYTASNMKDYVEEKTGGKYPAQSVTCISLSSLRELKIDEITEQLMKVKDFGKVVVNSIDYCDVKVFCVALYRAMAKGKKFMFRTAAGLVKVMGGITDQPLLTKKQMITKETSNGGIVIVGSHTQKTTAQMEALKTLSNVEFIEFNSDLVLEGDASLKNEVDRVVQFCETNIAKGKTVVAYTKRKLLTLENDTKEDALLRSVKISDAVQSLVGNLKITPGFVIAKGGITSSDIGTKALKVKKANVLGQIRPGIPVWQTGNESRFPKIPYVIFPGNVGDVNTLKEAVEVLID